MTKQERQQIAQAQRILDGAWSTAHLTYNVSDVLAAHRIVKDLVAAAPRKAKAVEK